MKKKIFHSHEQKKVKNERKGKESEDFFLFFKSTGKLPSIYVYSHKNVESTCRQPMYRGFLCNNGKMYIFLLVQTSSSMLSRHCSSIAYMLKYFSSDMSEKIIRTSMTKCIELEKVLTITVGFKNSLFCLRFLANI